MNAAALGLAAVALIISILAAAYTRRQAVASEQLVKIERSRDSRAFSEAEEAARQSQHPSIRLRADPLPHPGVTICNDGPGAARLVTVRLIAALDDARLPILTYPEGGVDLAPGQEMTFPLHTNRVSARQVRVKVEGLRNSERFSFELTLQIPSNSSQV